MSHRNFVSGVTAVTKHAWIALFVLPLMAMAVQAYDRSTIDACVDGGGSFDYQFGTCDSKHAHPGASSTCIQNLPGQWRVVGHSSPGVAALTEAEAKEWDGAVLSLRSERITFRGGDCATPRFQTREISADDFSDNYRALPSSLGLTSAEICVTEVSCNGPWNAPGSLLIHGRGRMYAFWDGMFFDLRRE